MVESKTLKDISLKGAKRRDVVGRRLVDYDEAKELAIKWVKEDKRNIDENPLLEVERIVSLQLLMRWMKRLNISEEDLNDRT